jgi:hypothetical protein
VPEYPTSLNEYLFTATFDVTGDPSTVKHHFLMLAVPNMCGFATAAMVKVPDTV